MKPIKTFTLILCIILSGFIQKTQAIATPPEYIPSKLVEVQPRAWYVEKSREWQNYLTENEGTAEEWLNYFRSSLYAGNSKADLSLISNQINDRFSDHFLAPYCQFKIMGWTRSGIAKLKQAISWSNNGDDEVLIPEKTMLAEFEGDNEARSDLNQELYNLKKLYPSLLNYSYNVLMSVSEEDVLIVQSEQTTIPLWILQDVMGIRKDVKILNLELASNGDYLNRWVADQGLESPESFNSEKVEERIYELHIANPERKFFYGLTLPTDRLGEVEDQLYVVGLTSLLSEQEFDHYNMLKENIENRFLVDYLTVNFSGEPKTSTGRVYETNYIVPFLLLKEYYEELGDAKSSDKWKEMVLTLAERSKIKNRVVLLMETSKDELAKESFKKHDINVKELDKKLKQIKGNIYASSTEVTNKEYWEFLEYLRTNGYDELYETSKPNLGKYDEITASFMRNYHYSPANYEIHVVNPKKYKKPSYLDYPAIEMSYDAANAYCEWLTFQYNNQEKREFKKVKFRLPSENEWKIAALGYKNFTSWNYEDNVVMAWEGRASIASMKDKEEKKEFPLSEYQIDYPWFYDIEYRQRITNDKNCYLANIKVPEEIICGGGIKGDGFTLMSPAATYFANGMGLYDVIGNVAEMIDEEGVAMGGSWNHPEEESTIHSAMNYEVSDVTVGFRIFMEVIEE